MIALGVGGNIGTEDEILERFRLAREALEALGRVRSAALYRTAPIGPAQAAFYNTALALYADDMQPTELIQTLLELERLLGRHRESETRWGPRTIDLDVLAWDQRVIETPALKVPHPRLGERRFALAPLGDLLGDAHVVPHVGLLGEALARVRDQKIELIRETW